MITVTKTPFELENVKAVHKVFQQTGFKLLEQVILGKLTEHSVEAMGLALESATFSGKTQAAEDALKKSIRYQTALDVLKEIKALQSFDTVVTQTTNS